MQPVDIVVPALGESVSSAIIAKWYKKIGDPVQENDILLELETDKVTLEITAPTTGSLQQISFHQGESVNIGDVVGVIAKEAVAETAVTEEFIEEIIEDEVRDAIEGTSAFTAELAAEISNQPMSAQSMIEESRIASPAAKKLIEERGLAIENVQGSGKGGRIMKEDVLNHQERTPQRPIIEKAETTPFQERETELLERKPMNALRRKIAERLKYAQNTAAILTTFNECDMSAVMELRQTHQDEFVKKHGTKLGFMSFFVRACVHALKEIPAVNGEIDGDDLLYHKRYDIGIAVSAPQGLVVPVLRRADQLGLHDIEKHISDFGEKAKANKLSMNDLTGGTFTISNGGVFGSLVSTPILNPPQSAILGMHKIQDRPVALNGQVVIRPMMYLALSYDHRIIDGREAVTFLVKVKNAIENPSRLLLGI